MTQQTYDDRGAPTSPGGRPLPTRQPWGLALLAPLLFTAPWLLFCRTAGVPAPAGTVIGGLLVLLLATATVTDLLWRRVFNWLTFTALAWGLGLCLLATVLPDGSPALPIQVLGALPPAEAMGGLFVGFLLLLLPYLVFQGGAGDVKLVAVLGLLLGWKAVVTSVFYGCLFAGLFGVGYLIWFVGPLALLLRLLIFLGVPGGFLTGVPEVGPILRRRIPMAPFLAAGVVASLVWRL